MRSFTIAKAFLDTNILVYSFGADEKSSIARSLLDQLSRNHQAVISTQILMEFHAVMIKKRKFAIAEAREMGRAFRGLEIALVTLQILDLGLEISTNHQLSVWDGLILSTASASRCEILYSEDLSNGTRLAGVEIRNPFR